MIIIFLVYVYVTDNNSVFALYINYLSQQFVRTFSVKLCAIHHHKLYSSLLSNRKF